MPQDITVYKKPAATASMIVEWQGEILLVQRKRDPFAGMWALPGGFLNCDEETLEAAGVRELKEETGLETAEEYLALLQANSDPKRDPRGHVIDHVFVVRKYWGMAKAADDAAELKYFPLNHLPSLAFDHEKSLTTYKETKQFVQSVTERLLKC